LAARDGVLDTVDLRFGTSDAALTARDGGEGLYARAYEKGTEIMRAS
jgi:hypothetical protein